MFQNRQIYRCRKQSTGFLGLGLFWDSWSWGGGGRKESEY